MRPAERTAVPRHRLRSVVTLLTLALAGATALPAVGATRYASPTGAGADPCGPSSPCALTTAVGGAAGADTVIVLPGTYTLASTLDVTDDGLVIEGVAGQPRPELVYAQPAGSAVNITGVDVTLRWLTVRGSTDGSSHFVTGFTGGGTFDRIEIRASGATSGLAARSATVRDSIVTVTTNFAWGVIMSGNMTGSTVVTPGAVSVAARISTCFFPDETLTIRNSILRGNEDVESSTSCMGSTATVDIDHSAYRAPVSGAGTKIEGPNNVSATPMLVDLAGATDLRQVAGSPTIGAGSNAAAAASAGDAFGKARIIDGTVDIGAHELGLPPTATSGTVTVTGPTTATIAGVVTPNGDATTYRVEFGTTPAYGAFAAGGALAFAAGATPVQVAVGGLSPSTTYHARLTALNATGTGTGADVTFTTPAAPDTVAPTLGRLTLARRTLRPRVANTMRFALGEAATVTTVLDRLIPGRRVGTRCRATTRSGTRCTIVRRVAVLRRMLARGNRAVGIPARPAGRALLPGTYRLSVMARDAAGNRSVVRRVIFTVRPPA